jgi:hypothetical protein
MLNMNLKPPDAELLVGRDVSRLYRNDVVIKEGTDQPDCDRMTIDYGTGNTEDVVICVIEGKKTVGRIRQTFSVVQGSVSSAATFTDFVDPVSATDQERLLALHNTLSGIADSKAK